MDSADGKLEISDCFAWPSPPALPEGDQAEDALAAAEQDALEFQQDMMRVLRDGNGDDNCVGLYRSVNMGDWCNADFIEQQFEQQDELDTAGIPRSVLIMYDPYQTAHGSLALKAVRLTDAFMDVMRSRNSPDARVAVATELALSHFLSSDVFYEIPIVIENSSLVKSYLYDLRPKLNLEAIEFEGLVVSTDPYLEKNVAFIVEELDRLQKEKVHAAAHARSIQTQKVYFFIVLGIWIYLSNAFPDFEKNQQNAFIAARKIENEQRAARGEEPLPLKDLTLDCFKTLKDTSKLSTLLIRKQVDIYCEQINAFSASSFELQFLRGAVNN